MRIIGGKYKGRRIPAASNLRARPTTDFARENLFNILSNKVQIEECEVLDLFSGTGSIAIEFASRGAKKVDLVELDLHHLQFIKKTIEQLQIENIQPIKGKAELFLKKTTSSYDIIFADPPYDSAILPKIPTLVFETAALKLSGWFILEHSQKYHFQDHLYFVEMRRYGSVHFSFFKNE